MTRHVHRCAPGQQRDENSRAMDRARERWGVRRALLEESPAAGTAGDLARDLQRHLRHLPVIMLHDRLVPADGLLVAHLAIAPGGVTVIEAAADLAPPLRAERLRGVFGARAEVLRDAAGADRSAVLAPVRERVIALRRLVADAAPVEGALCLTSGAVPPAVRPLLVGGILVAGPKASAVFAARQGALTDIEVASLVEHLHASCPPALK
jgi:hypothetical protein